MDKKYLLSVVIPVYNAAPWLEECIESVLKSAGSGSVQLILVDDGSTDESGSICDRYAQEYGFIHVIHQENRGVASARNLGLQYSAGDYIAWVDPDDAVTADWFSRISDVISREQPDVIVMDSLRFGDGGEKQEIYGRSAGNVNRDLFVEDVMRDIRIYSGLPNKVMKAELFLGIRFDETLTVLEDYAAMPEILKNARTVYYVPRCLYRYRQHHGSLLHDRSLKRAFQAVQTACRREKMAEPRFRAASVTAAALQMLYFCRSVYLTGQMQSQKAQMDFCIRYIRVHLAQLCSDKELPGHLKIKMTLLALKCYGWLLRVRNGKK